MVQKLRWGDLVIVILIIVLASGCPSTKHKIVPVDGKVTFADGKPIPAGTRILFRPFEGGVGMASATIEQDGSFSVRHPNGTKGAEEGKYIVLLQPKDEDKTVYKLLPLDKADDSLRVEGAVNLDIKDGMPPVTLKVAPAKK